MKIWILFLLGLTVTIVANWPSVVKAYFPWNLPFCFIGAVMAGCFAGKLLFKRLNR